MKVNFSMGINGFSGTIDGAVYYYHPRMKKSLMRKYVKPDNARNTDRTKAIMANLKLIQPSDGYKIDFNDYLTAYNKLKDYQHKPMLSWYNLYVKMLFALQKADAGVNLQTLTRTQIYEQNLPCKTVSAAIAAGLLPMVKNSQWLTKEL
jgi:hypothetical protein